MENCWQRERDEMDFTLVTCKDDIAPYLSALRQSKILAVDTETTGLDPHIDRIRLVQLATKGLPVFVIDCFSFLPEGLGMLKDMLEGSNVKIFQNAKFDLQFFMALDIHPLPIFDIILNANNGQEEGEMV